MERIVLEVDDTVGRIYQKFSSESKIRFNEAVSMMLKKATNNASFNAYKHELDNFGNEAVAKGLTQEELEKLLADD